MEQKYQIGQKVFLSGAHKGLIEEATVFKYSGGFYTIKFPGGGGTRVRESRLFPSMEAAEEEIKKRQRLLTKVDYMRENHLY